MHQRPAAPLQVSGLIGGMEGHPGPIWMRSQKAFQRTSEDLWVGFKGSQEGMWTTELSPSVTVTMIPCFDGLCHAAPPLFHFYGMLRVWRTVAAGIQ